MGTCFKELLNIENEECPTNISPPGTDLDICTDTFTLNELQEAINKMKSNKSPDIDFAVTVEALKFGGNKL